MGRADDLQHALIDKHDSGREVSTRVLSQVGFGVSCMACRNQVTDSFEHGSRYGVITRGARQEVISWAADAQSEI